MKHVLIVQIVSSDPSASRDGNPSATGNGDGNTGNSGSLGSSNTATDNSGEIGSGNEAGNEDSVSLGEYPQS